LFNEIEFIKFSINGFEGLLFSFRCFIPINYAKLHVGKKINYNKVLTYVYEKSVAITTYSIIFLQFVIFLTKKMRKHFYKKKKDNVIYYMKLILFNKNLNVFSIFTISVTYVLKLNRLYTLGMGSSLRTRNLLNFVVEKELFSLVHQLLLSVTWESKGETLDIFQFFIVNVEYI